MDRKTSALLFLILPFLFVFTFLLWPIIYTSSLSLFRWMGIGEASFMGVGNYVQVLSDPAYHRVLINNGIWLAFSVLGATFLGLLLAYVLSGRLRGKGLFTTLLWVPFAFSPVAIGLLSLYIFGYEHGFLNMALGGMGLGSTAWLGQWPLNTISLNLMALWFRIPFSAIIFLAGMTSIPRELTESAEMDGLSGFSKLRKVVSPMLWPFTIIVLTWNVLYTFQGSFELIWAGTQGGPFRSSETLSVSMFRESFQNSNYGLGCALAVIAMVIVLIVFVVLHRVRGRER